MRTRPIVAASAALLVLIALLAVRTHRVALADEIDTFSRRQLALVRTAAVGLQADLQGRIGDLHQLNALPTIQHLDRRYAGDRIRDVLGFDRSGVVLEVQRIDSDGRLHAWSLAGDPLADGTRAWGEQDLLAWARTPGNRGRVRLADDRTTDTRRTLLVAPVYAGSPSAGYPASNAFAGVTVLVLDFDRLVRRYLLTAGAGDDKEVTLLDEAGTVLFDAPRDSGSPFAQAADARTGAPLWSRMRREAEGRGVVSRRGEELPDEPIDQVVAWSSVETEGGRWVVAFNTSAAAVTAGARAAGRQVFWALLLMAAVGGTAWALLRSQRTEERYRELVERAADGIFVLDRRGQLLSANRAAEEMLGYPRGQLPGRLFTDLLGPGEAMDPLRAADQPSAITCGLLKRDGCGLASEISVSRLTDGCLLAIVRDMTGRRRLEQQLVELQKMEAVGRLAGAIAHDFNNFLSVIGGCSELLLAEPANERTRRELEEIRHAASRAASLTRQLLAFSRRQVFQAQLLSMNDLISGMEELLRRLAGETVDLRIEPGEELARVKGDAGQLEQVVMNLAVNARDAMPGGGTLTIRTENLCLDRSAAARYPGLAAGAYVRLSVSDTGVGMTAETRAQVFEPFFTTKAAGKGTGLGLSTVYGFIQQAGGYIDVSSEPGRGTTFEVLLPRAAAHGAS